MNKWAVVTGSSSGLGYAMVCHLLENDYKVAGGSRSGTDIDHENFYDIELDVSQDESVSEFYQTLSGLTSKVDLLINNAGICDFAPLEDISAEQFIKHFEVNCLGAMLMFREFESFIIPHQTRVFSILSTAAKTGFPMASSYVASKHALVGLIESLKKEWSSHRVRFTQFYSSAVDTPLWEGMDDEYQEKMLGLDDFISMFDVVLNAPEKIYIPELTFLHKEGFLD